MSTKLGLLSNVCIRLGMQKLSVIQRSSGVSAIQEVLKNTRDFRKYLLYHGCLLLRGVAVSEQICIVPPHRATWHKTKYNETH